ncbi:actin cortical patch SUR7/pH-response regulator pali [Calycina marina]|uniref:Actin cortical patch SUR7/pH-response regulator pali n=1 Tax=Calycina marina TaxID=1763456 RepID=A0A9P8CF90_9HELO|nr:actin cortical patch SUR7/pH-response regulator pali [Calycina marina]
MRITALAPLVCSIAAFILGMLCLFAGHKPGFLEDYHIVTLNTSTLGYNLVPTTTASGAAAATPTSLLSWIEEEAKNITSEIENEFETELNNIAGDIADKLASELGIDQWYSLHLMDYCEGTYSPNATAKGAKKNVTSCSKQTAMYHFDITQTIDDQLHLGKYNISLTDIDWSDKLQDGINALNVAMDATFVLYAIGIAAAGLAILTSLIAFFLHGSRLISFGNWGLASIAFIAFLICSIIITIVQKKFTSIINKYGNDIGLYAHRGSKYLVITWVATAVMFLAMVAWVVEFCIGRKKRSREYTEKRSGGWRHRRSDESALRRSGV